MSRMYICHECWEGGMKDIPNLIDIPYRNFSKIRVECEQCNKVTETPHIVEVSNMHIEIPESFYEDWDSDEDKAWDDI